MSLETTLKSWTEPSSVTEQEKQERTLRMVRQALAAHSGLSGCSFRVFVKGSYANNTNVRADSDVDIAVECTEAVYWDEDSPGVRPPVDPYLGQWNPTRFRSEVVAALQGAFAGEVDTSGSTAIHVNSGSARVDADVVPCFTYERHLQGGSVVRGTKIFGTSGREIVNYPAQQLENGRQKNVRTGHAYKRATRMLKRVENAVADAGSYRPLPSYFVECLAYNCPDAVFMQPTWTERLRAMLVHIYNTLEGVEPAAHGDRWLEVNEWYFLFHDGQQWTRADGRAFSAAAWQQFGLE